MYEDKNQAWIKWARRFNAQNKIYPDQDVNNWLVELSHCRACVDDWTLAFGRDEDCEKDIYNALNDEKALDLCVADEEGVYGELYFNHIPSGLRFRVTEEDNIDFINGKEVYLYGFYPERD